MLYFPQESRVSAPFHSVFKGCFVPSFFKKENIIIRKNGADGIHVDSYGSCEKVRDPAGEAEAARRSPHGKRSVFSLRVTTTKPIQN
ncbi:hypothetical protein A499_25373, partial [Niallia nealsonii AAU1]